MKKLIFSNEKIVAENKYLRAIQKDFIDSKNRKWNAIMLESVKSWNWSFILALTKDNKIILNKEYKFWPDEFIYNFPSWHIAIWLTWKENIKKELKEESWYTTDNEIIYLWKTIQNWYIGWYNELYFTTWCYKIQEQDTHEWEEIENYFISIQDFEKMLDNNEILDTYTENCYYRAKKITNNFTNLDI